MDDNLASVKCIGNVLGCHLWYSVRIGDLRENKKRNGEYLCEFCEYKLSNPGKSTKKPEKMSIDRLGLYFMGVAFGGKVNLYKSRLCGTRLEIEGIPNPPSCIPHELFSKFCNDVIDESNHISDQNIIQFLMENCPGYPNVLPDVPDQFFDAFLAGFIHFSDTTDILNSISVHHHSADILNQIKKRVSIPSTIWQVTQNLWSLTWYDCNYVDLIKYISCGDRENITRYCNIWNNKLYPVGFTWMKTLPEAVAPLQKRLSDAGIDLTLVKEIKRVVHNDDSTGKSETVWFDTGIAIRPNFAYYFKLYPRSSLTNEGWFLANSVGVIDASYTASVIVALTRKGMGNNELTLPNRCVQLVPERVCFMPNGEQVESFSETSRGTGGFGSTN